MENISMQTTNYSSTGLAGAKSTDAAKNTKPSASDAKVDQVPKKEAAGTSEPMPAPSGGTVAYSKDGDIFENKSGGTAQANTQNVSAASSGAATSASSSVVTSESEDSSDSVDSNKAANMLAQGYSDSKIKEQTGVSQQELDNLRKKAEGSVT